jgi:TubC N-terminal docking domain
MARPVTCEVLDVPGPVLLRQLQADGFELVVDGDRLRIRPAARVSPQLRDVLAKHKGELLAMLKPSRGFVTLRNGPTVPAEALLLALDLEQRSIPLATDADHQFISPKDSRLTADDDAAIQRWRHHLGAIVEYRAPEVS